MRQAQPRQSVLKTESVFMRVGISSAWRPRADGRFSFRDRPPRSRAGKADVFGSERLFADQFDDVFRNRNVVEAGSGSRAFGEAPVEVLRQSFLLVAGKVFTGDYDPVRWADVVTTTTHKTLRGPRGGMILCKEEFAESVDKGCPLVIGGPLPHVMAAKAIAFEEAGSDSFRAYAAKIQENASDLAAAFISLGAKVATGGTDNHLMLIDVTPYGLNGRQAESLLRDAGITLNRNALPFDPNGPWYTSGLRLGTPAVTTLGMGKAEMEEIAAIIVKVLSSAHPVKLTKGEHAGQLSKNKAKAPDDVMDEARKRVQALLDSHLLYPELDLAFLEKAFPVVG